MQNEIWKDAPGFPGYQVSNAGRVRSFERILDPDNVKGYYRVRLYRKGRVSRVYIHRLVASAFVPNPDGLPQINHKNEIKTDNRPDSGGKGQIKGGWTIYPGWNFDCQI